MKKNFKSSNFLTGGYAGDEEALQRVPRKSKMGSA
jgi:hypothetical protein